MPSLEIALLSHMMYANASTAAGDLYRRAIGRGLSMPTPRVPKYLRKLRDTLVGHMGDGVEAVAPAAETKRRGRRSKP